MRMVNSLTGGRRCSLCLRTELIGAERRDQSPSRGFVDNPDNLQEHTMPSTTSVTLIASRPPRTRRQARIALAIVGAFMMLATANRSAEAQTAIVENADV